MHQALVHHLAESIHSTYIAWMVMHIIVGIDGRYMPPLGGPRL